MHHWLEPISTKATIHVCDTVKIRITRSTKSYTINNAWNKHRTIFILKYSIVNNILYENKTTQQGRGVGLTQKNIFSGRKSSRLWIHGGHDVNKCGMKPEGSNGRDEISAGNVRMKCTNIKKKKLIIQPFFGLQYYEASLPGRDSREIFNLKY